MSFNVGDKVVVTKSNLSEYVGEEATVVETEWSLYDGPVAGVIVIRFDNDIHGPLVNVENDGSLPWMEGWLEKVHD